MSLSNSRNAYLDCYELLNQALDEARGVRIEVADYATANYLRMRIHHARTIDRSENERTYDPGHALHGRSPYDVLVCRIEEANGNAWLYLDKQKVEIGRIQPIPEDHRIEFTPAKALASEEIVIEEPVVVEAPKQIPYIRRR